MGFALLEFNLLGAQHPFLLSHFSHLEWKCLSYACFTLNFRSAELLGFTCSLTAGEEFLPQDES